MSKEYLSRKDIKLDGVDLEKHYPLLTPSMGSGKTYFVFSGELKNVYESHSNRKIDIVIYATPTKALKNQTLIDYAGNATPLTEYDLFYPDLDDKRIRVCCVSQLGKILQENTVRPAFTYLLVIDEFDEYAKWCNCHSDKLYLWDWIESNRHDVMFCGITATPKLLTKYAERLGFKDITPDVPVKHKAKNIRIWPHTSIETLAKGFKADSDNKMLIYTRSAKQCVKLSRMIENSGFLVSTYNKDVDEESGKQLNTLMSEQLVDDGENLPSPLLDYVLSKANLPPNINVLIINDAYAAGINIKDESVKRVLAESVEVDTVKQVMGRVRHDIESLDVCYTFKDKKYFETTVSDANECYAGNVSIEDRHEREQKEIEVAEQNDSNLELDILTYKSNYDGEIKPNPFAHAYYEYTNETYFRLRDRVSRCLVYAPLAQHSPNGIRWLNQSTIDSFREHGRNQSKVENMNLSEWLGRKLFKEDKKELVKQLSLRNGKGRVSSWPTAKKYLIELGYEIKDSNTVVNGKSKRYSMIKIHTKL